MTSEKDYVLGLDLVAFVPDYTKTLEENEEIWRQKYFDVYGEYPPEEKK